MALLTAHRCTPSAGWSGFDTLEPARWVGGTGATIVVPTNNPQGVEAGSDDSRIGGWPRQYQRAALRSVQYKGEERSDEHTFSERSEQELVLMPIV